MRKPIQITALRFGGRRGEAADGQDSIATEVIALCDDGTIWTLFGTDGDWVPLPRIPQIELYEDWLKTVGTYLMRDHHVRKEAIPGLQEEYEDLLRRAYNDTFTGQAAAKALHDKVTESA